MPKTIAVVFGGVSNENEISVVTGTMAINILKNGGYEGNPVFFFPVTPRFLPKRGFPRQYCLRLVWMVSSVYL